MIKLSSNFLQKKTLCDKLNANLTWNINSLATHLLDFFIRIKNSLFLNEKCYYILCIQALLFIYIEN